MKVRSATTLIEILMYFVLVSALLTALLSFAFRIYNNTQRSVNIQEIQANVDLISQELSSRIQSANSIDVDDSLFNVDEGRLSLVMNDASINPSVYYLSNGSLYLMEGVGSSPIQLSSNLSTLQSFNITHVSSPNAPDQVQIQAEIQPANTDIESLNHSFDLQLTITLRQ